MNREQDALDKASATYDQAIDALAKAENTYAQALANRDQARTNYNQARHEWFNASAALRQASPG